MSVSEASAISRFAFSSLVSISLIYYLFIELIIKLLIYLSFICLSVCLSIYLSVYLLCSTKVTKPQHIAISPRPAFIVACNHCNDNPRY